MSTGKPWKPVLMIPCILALAAAAVAADPVTKVIVRPLAGQPAGRIPVTFGQVFKKGDMRQGVLASAPGRRSRPTSRANMTTARSASRWSRSCSPSWTGRRRCRSATACGRNSAASCPSRPPICSRPTSTPVVRLKFPDGQERSASARALLKAAGTGAKTWLAGPVASEWLLVGPLVGKDGTPDADLRVQFHVRAYAGCKAVRVAVIVENCLDTWAGNIGYDVAVLLGRPGQVVYEKKNVDHRRLSRWRKDFWWPAAPPPAKVIHDLAYLSASGALPNYDRSLVIPERPWRPRRPNGVERETDIMGSGSLCKYMPTTGGRPEIGPYPNWTVEYLLSIVLRNADPQQHGRDDGGDVRAAGVQQAGLLGCPHGGRRAIGNAANPRWMITAPWEHDYLI